MCSTRPVCITLPNNVRGGGTKFKKLKWNMHAHTHTHTYSTVISQAYLLFKGKMIQGGGMEE